MRVRVRSFLLSFISFVIYLYYYCNQKCKSLFFFSCDFLYGRYLAFSSFPRLFAYFHLFEFALYVPANLFCFINKEILFYNFFFLFSHFLWWVYICHWRIFIWRWFSNIQLIFITFPAFLFHLFLIFYLFFSPFQHHYFRHFHHLSFVHE